MKRKKRATGSLGLGREKTDMTWEVEGEGERKKNDWTWEVGAREKNPTVGEEKMRPSGRTGRETEKCNQGWGGGRKQQDVTGGQGEREKKPCNLGKGGG